MTATGEPLLRIENATKIYGGTYALKDVDFELRSGEIHALVGENGAGKSTLCKVIAGAIPLTAGRYLIEGRDVQFSAPGDALRAGIGMVYQETSLVSTMTVSQNLFLGRERMFNNTRKLNIEAQQLLRSLRFPVDSAALVSTLGAAQRQMVEIARAVQRKARAIIFDEPTATLTPEEILHFFQLVRELRDQGLGLIFISHAVEEALRLSDRITVLRDGQRIITASTQGMVREDIIRHMVGRSTAQFTRPHVGQQSHGVERRKVLSVQNVTMGLTVKNMSFNAYEGEILAIAGLVGSGRTEIAKIIAGALKRNWLNGGLIYLDGKPIRYRIPKQAIKDGIVYITEDRKINGFFETMRIDENVYIGRLATKFGRRLFISGRQKRKIAQQFTEQLSIHSINANPKIIELSGGNQQKVVIAKSLVQKPRVIIFDEPTRGVDVGAIPQIHQTIRELAAQGLAVIVISSYLPEILALGDRILVARNGRIAAELPAADADEHKIMRAAIH